MQRLTETLLTAAENIYPAVLEQEAGRLIQASKRGGNETVFKQTNLITFRCRERKVLL